MENQKQSPIQQQKRSPQENQSQEGKQSLESLLVSKLVEFEKKVEKTLEANAQQQRESMKLSLQSVSAMLNDIMSSLVSMCRDIAKMKSGPGIVGANGQRIFTPGGNGTGKG